MRKLVQGVNDLYTWCMQHGQWGQQLLYEFGDGNNSQKFINEHGVEVTPHDVSRASARKIKWKCSNGHEWYDSIAHRTSVLRGCKSCGRENSAKMRSTARKGINDLYTWCLNNEEYGQKIISEWTGICDDGNQYEIDNVTHASSKKMLWKCSIGHEWYATIHDRSKVTNCPYCSGKVASKDHNLYIWCKSNGEYGQQLLNEWTGICDDGNQYEMTKVTIGSAKRMLWKCSKGHKWYSGVNQRTHGSACRECFNENASKLVQLGKIKKGVNDLLTWCNSNGEYGEQLLTEWTGISDDNRSYKIDELAKSSYVKLLWKCSEGHEWFAYLSDRTNGHKCPYCYGLKASDENNLEKWCQFNEDFGQQLINEWTGICDDNKQYKMKDVTRGSKKKMLWKCSKGHKWYANIVNRTNFLQGCPYCNVKSTSYPEQFLYRALKQIYPQTISREKFNNIEYDITIPEEKTCIEYSGYAWHEDKIDRDLMKAQVCKEHNVRFIQIYAHSGEIDNTDNFDSDTIIYKADWDKKSHDEQLTKILKYIVESFGHNINEIDIEKAGTEAFNFMHNTKDSLDNEQQNAQMIPKTRVEENTK